MTFQPTTGGQYGGTIEVASNKTGGDSQTTVSGVGELLTRIIALSGNLDFGAVAAGQTAQRTLQVSNLGNSPLSVTAIHFLRASKDHRPAG